MAHIPADLIEFLRELELNNNREWFEANKKRYEASVKAPMEAFAATMIERMREIYPDLDVAPKSTLFRIYRDVRFSKEKTPYKTHVGMAVGPKGRRDPNSPSFSVHLGPRDFYFGSGYYMVDPEQLKAIRTHIAANLVEFQARLDDAPFRNLFGTVKGECGKLLPPELKAAAERQPLVFNKQFYYGAEYDPEVALGGDVPEFLMTHMRASMPMNDFLRRALT